MSDDEGGFGSSSDDEEMLKQSNFDKQTSERAHELAVQQPPRRGSFSRRGGVQTSSVSVFQGLKAKYDAMEKLEDDDTRRHAEGIRASDIDFIRMLQPAQFRMFLQRHGVQVDRFGCSETNAKSVRDLWAEVVFRECELEQYDDEDIEGGLGLQRKVAVVFIEIKLPRDDGESRFLLLRDEKKQMSVGRKNLDTRPSRKMYDDEDVESATWRCMFQNLNMPEKLCKQHFRIESSELRGEIKESVGFPGLRTIYDMHIVRMTVNDPESPDLAMVGLPDGVDFETRIDNVIAGSSTRHWCWATEADFGAAKVRHAGKLSICHHPGAALQTAALIRGDDAGSTATTADVSPRLDGTATRSSKVSSD